MKKLGLFLSIFIVGITIIVLELALFRVSFALIIIGAIAALGGAIGSCIHSKRARKFFEWIFDIIALPFFS
ncbi:MAG: hypothetical protein FWE19_08395 [Oscillospiraceae bacterium]|nr:hypothetical protein [Oscillospiraceae bacterium]